MNFDTLQKGALSLVAGFTTAFNLSPIPNPSVAPLAQPVVIESQNVNETSQSLSLASNSEKLEMVTKEVEAPKSQDVMFYTVVQPPIPTPEPKEEKLSLVKEAKAAETETPISSPSSTPTPTPSPSATPESTPQGTQGTDSDVLFQMANDHRTKMGLTALEKDERVCKITRARAPQINAELSSGTLHKGFYGLNLPYWASENIAAYSTIEQDFNFWLSDYIHKKAIEGDYKYSCVSCSGASCSQVFTNFSPK